MKKLTQVFRVYKAPSSTLEKNWLLQARPQKAPYPYPTPTLSPEMDIIHNYKKAMEAVKDDSFNIVYVDKSIITYDMCMTAVEQDGDTFAHINDKFKTKELCEIAVQYNGVNLGLVPEKLITYDLCLKAVCAVSECDDGYTALQYVPDKFKTPELCLASVKNYPESIILLKNPSIKLYLIAVQHDPFVLEVIDADNQTEEMCLAAVKENARALECVKPALKTYEVCLAAANSKKYREDAVHYIPDEIKKKIYTIRTIKKNKKN